jgi:hypothetical protein
MFTRPRHPSVMVTVPEWSASFSSSERGSSSLSALNSSPNTQLPPGGGWGSRCSPSDSFSQEPNPRRWSQRSSRRVATYLGSPVAMPLGRTSPCSLSYSGWQPRTPVPPCRPGSHLRPCCIGGRGCRSHRPFDRHSGASRGSRLGVGIRGCGRRHLETRTSSPDDRRDG